MTLSKRTNAVSQVETKLHDVFSIDTAMDLEYSGELEVQPGTIRTQPRNKKLLNLTSGESKENLMIEGKIFRIDDQHCKFQPCDLLSEPQIHLSIKSDPPSDLVDVEKLVDHRQAIQICKGLEVQLIMVTHDPTFMHTVGYETDPELTDLGSLARDSLVDVPQAFEYSTVNNLPELTPVFALDEENTDQSGCVPEISPRAADVESPETKPAWEVGSFRWSKTVRQLCAKQKTGFSQLIESLDLKVHGGSTRIGVIHSHPQQGATTLATCLANLLADSQSKILLTELDVENPNLEERANINFKAGWQKLIDQDADIGEFLVREKRGNLTLMPLKREKNLVSRRGPLLKKITQISAKLNNQFDYSIFDIGCLENLMIGETCHTGFLDGAIIVSDFCGNESVAISIFERLVEAGLPAVVIAENFRNQSRTAA